jgi:hypothetical protein
VIAALKQQFRHMTADKTGTAGDEDALRHADNLGWKDKTGGGFGRQISLQIFLKFFEEGSRFHRFARHNGLVVFRHAQNALPPSKSTCVKSNKVKSMKVKSSKVHLPTFNL